ncbi:hypothetical protein ACO0RG_001228 [Hanseniaspora osmophila]
MTTIPEEKQFRPTVFTNAERKPKFLKKQWCLSYVSIGLFALKFTSSILAIGPEHTDIRKSEKKKVQLLYEKDSMKSFEKDFFEPRIQIIIDDFNLEPKVIDNEAKLYAKTKNDLHFSQYNSLLTQIKLKPKVRSIELSKGQFEQWIAQETEISFQRILDNIADTNLNTLIQSNVGMQQGVSIASPSKQHPNYFFQWIRDASITINTVINKLHYELQPDVMSRSRNPVFSGKKKNHSTKDNVHWLYFGTVLKHFNNSFVLQRTPNLSGQFSEQDLLGLGEPKFNVDDSAFMEGWGRPQNDGPALRVIAAMNLLNIMYLNNLQFETVTNVLQKNSIIDQESLNNMHFHNELEFFMGILYYDLKYIMGNWNQDSFDLWEEVKAKHFFTSLVQLKALKMAISFIENDVFGIFNDLDTHHNNNINFNVTDFHNQLEIEYDNLLNFMLFESGYISPGKNHIIETPLILQTRSGLDIGTIIGTLLTHDDHFVNKNLSDYDFPFDVDDSGVMSSLVGLVNEMRILYPINHARLNLDLGVALGRYPEDIYNGDGTSEGNPWFLATSTAAELCYKLVYRFYNNGQDLFIPLNHFNSKDFFWNTILDVPTTLNTFGVCNTCNSPQDFLSGPLTKRFLNYELIIKHNSPAYNATMYNLLAYGDSFLDKLREHVSGDGEMSEQMNKYTGFLQGANNLTWSYGAFWNSVQWRQNVYAIMT